MNNNLICGNCTHKSVCIYSSTLENLQNQLNLELEHTTFRDDRNVYGVKLKDVDFIKTVKIECRYYERDTSILEG